MDCLRAEAVSEQILGHCQTNADLSMRCAICPRAIDNLRRNGAPFRQCGRASLFVHLPGEEMPLLIEMVMDLGVYRAELLQRLLTSKPLHRPLLSSKRLARILRLIVETATNLVPICGADLIHRRGIRAKSVGDDLPRWAVFLHDPLQKLQRRRLASLRRDHRLQAAPSCFTARQGTTELSVDLHKNFIQMPAPLKMAAHVRPRFLRLTILWIQWPYVDVPPLSAGAKVMIGGALVLGAVILIRSS